MVVKSHSQQLKCSFSKLRILFAEINIITGKLLILVKSIISIKSFIQIVSLKRFKEKQNNDDIIIGYYELFEERRQNAISFYQIEVYQQSSKK